MQGRIRMLMFACGLSRSPVPQANKGAGDETSGQQGQDLLPGGRGRRGMIEAFRRRCGFREVFVDRVYRLCGKRHDQKS